MQLAGTEEPRHLQQDQCKNRLARKEMVSCFFFLYEIRKKLLPPVLRDTIQLQYKQFWYRWKKLIVSLPKLNSLNGMKKSFWNIRVTIFVHVKWNKKSRKQERKNQEGGERK